MSLDKLDMMPKSHESRTEFRIVTGGCAESSSCNATETLEIQFKSSKYRAYFLRPVLLSKEKETKSLTLLVKHLSIYKVHNRK
jgi:hypothetical protein